MRIPKEDDFVLSTDENQITGAHEFKDDEQLTKCGEKLLEDCPEFTHITDMDPRICFLWKRKGGNSRGKRQFSNVQKCSPLAKFLGQYEFVVWVAADHAFNMGFDDEKIEAAIYRALKRLQLNKQDDADGLCVVSDEFSGSIDELRRYGAWFEEYKNLTERIVQLSLFKGQILKRKKGSKEVEPLFPQGGTEEHDSAA